MAVFGPMPTQLLQVVSLSPRVEKKSVTFAAFCIFFDKCINPYLRVKYHGILGYYILGRQPV